MEGSVYVYSKTGAKNVRKGCECEDYIEVFSCQDAFACVCVADGMGGTSAGGEAARIAVETSVRALRSLLNKQIPWSIGVSVKAAFLSSAREISRAANGGDILDYGTTLMVAVLWQSSLFFGYCGDGAIICRVGSRSCLAATPSRGENSETADLLSGQWTFGRIDGVDSFLVATDGLGNRLLDSQDFPNDYAEGLLGLGSQLKDACERLDGLFDTANTVDDKTICLVVGEESIQECRRNVEDASGFDNRVGQMRGFGMRAWFRLQNRGSNAVRNR